MAMIDAPDDQAKFEKIYHKYRYLMLHVAKQILQNHHDAEDAVCKRVDEHIRQPYDGTAWVRASVRKH